MSALIVLAHPAPDSLNHHLSAIAEAALREAGHDVVLVDLYGEDFDPCLDAVEKGAYHADRPAPASDAVRHGELLRAAETLVLVFPTWWFGPPAILKGWIDRVFSPGVAFDHGKNFGPIVPKLDRLRRVAIVTTLGSPWWIDRLVMGRPVRRIFRRAIIGACAPEAKLIYLPLHGAEAPAPQKVRRFERRLAATLKAM